MQEKLKILVADDHRMFMDGIKLLLESNPRYQVVCMCANGKEALSFVKDNPVDVALLDVNMPEMDGAETTKALKQMQPTIKIIIVTMHQELGIIRKMLRAGADSYLLKETSAQELYSAIDKIFSGENYVSPLISSAVMQALKTNVNEDFTKLTLRETEVLKLISNGSTTAEIATHIGLSVNTIETHRRNMLSKLGLKNTAQLVRYSVERGLLE